MNKLIFKTLLLFIIFVNSFESVSQDVQFYYSKAKAARESKDYESFYTNIIETNKLHPYHQGVLYQLGLACALTNRPEEAITALRKAIHIDAKFDLASPELVSIKGTGAYDELLQLQKDLMSPIINSDTAFVVKDNGSHIESITYNKKDQSFFFGSIHKRKIIRRDKSGRTSDFTSSGEYGLGAVFGVRTDAKRGMLWACASPMPEMENYDSTLHSAVFQFDIKTGKLINKYETKTLTASVFGDLTLNSKGQVFVSDGKSNSIFVVNESTRQLDLFYTSEEFWNIQGISFSTDDRYLFISDYIKGLYRLEIGTKTLLEVPHEIEQSLKGIDGLLFYNGDLIAIQNGVSPLRATRYTLNNEMTRISSATIIDRGHPAFNEPTMGCLNDTEFYYVANSAWKAYDDNFQLKPELVKNVVILKTNFKK